MGQELISRDQVKEADQWDLQPMFANEEEWEQEYDLLVESLGALEMFAGMLDEAPMIFKCLEAIAAVQRRLEKLYVWASLKSNQDLSDGQTSERLKRVQLLANQFAQITAYVEPELVKLEDDFLDKMIADEQFAEHVMSLRGVKRSKQHVLSDKEEALLARAGILWSDPYTIFGSFDNVDADFKPVKIDGEEVPVTHGTYSKLLENRDREVRKQAFESMYKEYEAHIHTLSDVLHAQVKQHDFKKDVRGYGSALERALHGKAIDPAVYQQLIDQVGSQLYLFYGYVDKRRQLLGLDEIAMWDLRVPLNQVDFEFSYEEAVEMVVKAVEPMGADYQKVMQDGLTTGRWVDRYENKGKRSGAFSSGCYDSPPYILMNFTGTLNDVYTLMHEAGHSMHSYLANQNQPFGLADYPIFTAEIASTVNERLLTSHLLSVLEAEQREAVLHYEVDAIRATFFRQTMFAEFELLLHETVANGVPLTKDFLCAEYEKLNAKYYGPKMAKDEYIQYEWARIPHMYYNFYVYQYATGIAAAYNFAAEIMVGRPEQYLELLKSGGKDYPVELIKQAGVDMASGAFYAAITDRFAELVGEL